MRYLYRPHRGGLVESMAECAVFVNEDAIKDHVIETYSHYGVCLNREDVIIDPRSIDDERTSWGATRYVCVTHLDGPPFEIPQCVGMCCDEAHLPEGLIERIATRKVINEAMDRLRDPQQGIAQYHGIATGGEMTNESIVE